MDERTLPHNNPKRYWLPREESGYSFDFLSSFSIFSCAVLFSLGFAFYFQFDPVMKRDRKSGSREHAKLTKQGGREACLVAKEKSQTQTVIGY